MIHKPWLIAALIDWTILAGGVWLSYFNVWFLPLSVLIVGNRQHALAILGHDGAHRGAARSKRLNDALTNCMVFYPLGLCLNHYRDFHWDHHRYAGTEKDPELPLKDIGPFRLVGPFKNKTQVIGAALFDLIGFGAPQLLAFLFYVRPRSIKDLAPLVVSIALAIILILNGLWLTVAIWYVSLWTAFWCFFRLRVWSEHVGGGEGETLVYDPKWYQKALFLPHNTWLHHEHHLKPGVTFDKLPKLREELIGKGLCESREQNYFRKG